MCQSQVIMQGAHWVLGRRLHTDAEAYRWWLRVANHVCSQVHDYAGASMMRMGPGIKEASRSIIRLFQDKCVLLQGCCTFFWPWPSHALRDIDAHLPEWHSTRSLNIPVSPVDRCVCITVFARWACACIP